MTEKQTEKGKRENKIVKKYIIKQKISGTGNACDLASAHCDRTIEFPGGCEYAVVMTGIYTVTGKSYTTHRTLSAAQTIARKNRNYILQIIDSDGRQKENEEGKI